MANWTIMNESPKALGTVQIIIGAVVFLFGFVLKSVSDSEIIINSVNSNIIYWGSFSFIISGALSVASLDTSHPSLKHTIGNSKVLLGFSVLEIIVSIATFVLTWKVRSSTETTSAAVPHST
ncbi:membrane-spanning 4-domains subfamily A member 15-like isoform X2 [Silurus meridionalis]|uniref:membrane-spanning 4-domains subfamily A member 15-like isoform X2 n=1 Tax=Silurus meridionalis TaxID=175797 RepID=UPI001EEB0374|nr:membrane-spanning 4-domains subfamily A member 15-like isoform X2 [Silurus meridionalis]